MKAEWDKQKEIYLAYFDYEPVLMSLECQYYEVLPQQRDAVMIMHRILSERQARLKSRLNPKMFRRAMRQWRRIA